MDNNINFNELWAKQKTGEPNKEDLLLKINKFKKSNLKRLIITNLLLFVTSVFIVFVWVHYQPEMMTTKIGIVATILAMAIYVIVYNKSFGLFKKTTNTQSNSDYLKDLLAIRTNQQFMQTTMLNLYFVLLSTGIGLYMYEYTQRMTTLWAVCSYGITGFWIVLNWFYFRPKQIKKQEAKLNDIISKFQLLNNQLDE
jgi:hypothetical protein